MCLAFVSLVFSPDQLHCLVHCLGACVAVQEGVGVRNQGKEKEE